MRLFKEIGVGLMAGVFGIISSFLIYIIPFFLIFYCMLQGSFRVFWLWVIFISLPMWGWLTYHDYN